MNQIKIGRYYKAKPQFTVLAEQTGGAAHENNNAIKPKTMLGRCVFVHPQGRFVTLEFAVRGALSGSASGRVKSLKYLLEHPTAHLQPLREMQESGVLRPDLHPAGAVVGCLYGQD